MEVRPMEITLFSAKDLKDVRIISEMDVYAVVSVLGDPGWMQNQKQMTPVHYECGSNPQWNHKMTFIINEGAAQQNLLTLKINIKTERTLLNDTTILAADFSIKELFDEKDEAKSCEYFTSNITSDGESLGTFYWMCKFGEKFTVVPRPPGGSSSGGVTVSDLVAAVKIGLLLGGVIS